MTISYCNDTTINENRASDDSMYRTIVDTIYATETILFIGFFVYYAFTQ